MQFSRDICLGSDEILARSPTYRAIVDRVVAFFGVRPVRTLVNLYRDGEHWCNLHSDQYHQGGYAIDLTIGCSFGAEREVVFVEKANKSHEFTVPQRNGDIFAFSDNINNTWQHMIPRGPPGTGPRISVIVWCQRRDAEGTEAGSENLELGDFPHMFDYNPKGKGRDFQAQPGRGRDFQAQPELAPKGRNKGDGKGGRGGKGAGKGDGAGRGGGSFDGAVGDVSGRATAEREVELRASGLSEAEAAGEVALRALTLQGAQQVFAIVRGKKLLENRGWRIPLGWHAIHTGSQLINDERAERTRQAWPDAPRESDLPHGAVIGLFHIKEHRRPNQCKDGYIWARGPVCHVISKAIELPRPVRCSGGSGLWTLPGDVREEIRAQMHGPEAPEVRQFDLSVALGDHM